MEDEMRYIDIHCLEAALVMSNEQKINNTYPFIVNDDKSYDCPRCRRHFDPVYEDPNNRESYTKINPQARKHYNRILCISRSELIKKGYLRNDLEGKLKGKICKKRPFLSPAVKKILHLSPYHVIQVQEYAIKLLNKQVLMQVDISDTHIPSDIYKLRRVPSCILLSSIIKRCIDIPNVSICMDNDVDIQIPSGIQPNFESLDHIKYFIRQTILFDDNYSTPEMKLYVPCIKASETKRKFNPEITRGMEEYLSLIDYIPPEIRSIGLLSTN